MLHGKSSLPATPFVSRNLTLSYTHNLGVIAADDKIILIFFMNNDHNPIDLFTDMAAIFNLLDSRSIMGCPGALARYLRALFDRAKRELHSDFTVYFSGKRQSLLHLNTAQRVFFPMTIIF